MQFLPAGKSAWIAAGIVALIVLVIDWKTGKIRETVAKIPAVGDFLTKKSA